MSHTPIRHRLPTNRPGVTRKMEACGFDMYVTVSFFDDGRPGEVFTKIAKAGSTVSGFMAALATTISIALQYGVPWGVLHKKYSAHEFEPHDDKNVSLVGALASAVDEAIRNYHDRTV